MDKKKVEDFAAGIVRECEQQGFTVEEAQLLPQMIKSAVAQSVKSMKMQSGKAIKATTIKIKIKGGKKAGKRLNQIKKKTKQLNRALKKSAELRKKLF